MQKLIISSLEIRAETYLGTMPLYAFYIYGEHWATRLLNQGWFWSN